MALKALLGEPVAFLAPVDYPQQPALMLVLYKNECFCRQLRHPEIIEAHLSPAVAELCQMASLKVSSTVD